MLVAGISSGYQHGRFKDLPLVNASAYPTSLHPNSRSDSVDRAKAFLQSQRSLIYPLLRDAGPRSRILRREHRGWGLENGWFGRKLISPVREAQDQIGAIAGSIRVELKG